MLEQLFAGEPPPHPVFRALVETVERRNLEIKPFRDLISAFRQDQTKTRYQTFKELIDYCSRSANPVGRLVLACFDAATEKNIYYSDLTCSGLQLTNFWADVAIDLDKDRIYIPAEDMRRFGVSTSQLLQRKMNDQLRNLLAFEVERTRNWLENGRNLLGKPGLFASFSIDIFNSGGLAVLDKLEQKKYTVFQQRWTIGKLDRIKIILGALGRMFSRKLGQQ